ncbi:hypothetical protein ACWT_5032 [Actinoplanes sp. SE50]|nr:hypothetical protein ACPL_5162 [Actinoplanes sp. SE50/110]ATO84447.1 hypothetical protein ACWT_5032 [Actinoplanes sp. SE50]SLM01857.1 hypothetical protein ACSP50_5095 [Actinoplanes sp. SE50/110]
MTAAAVDGRTADGDGTLGEHGGPRRRATQPGRGRQAPVTGKMIASPVFQAQLSAGAPSGW